MPRRRRKRIKGRPAKKCPSVWVDLLCLSLGNGTMSYIDGYQRGKQKNIPGDFLLGKREGGIYPGYPKVPATTLYGAGTAVIGALVGGRWGRRVQFTGFGSFLAGLGTIATREGMENGAEEFAKSAQQAEQLPTPMSGISGILDETGYDEQIEGVEIE